MNRFPLPGVRGVLAALAVLLAGAPAADAQYFGHSTVRYEDFDFQVLETEHFDVYYYAQEAGAVEMAARMAERWYTRLSQTLDHELRGRQPLILYAAHPHFRQTNAITGEIGEGTGGVTESFKRRIVLPFAGSLADTDHVLGHELVHAFQYDMADTVDAGGNLIGPAITRLPLWFVEGMAEYLSLGPTEAGTAMWLRDAVAGDRFPAVEDLGDPDYFPYRFGHGFWAYVAGRWGTDAVGELYRAVGPRGDIQGAMQAVLGLEPAAFSDAWRRATEETYGSVLAAAHPVDGLGRIVVPRDEGGDINLGPALSPDGQRVVYLSERSQFSLDMYVADVETGEVLRQLATTAANPHLDSLEFLESAGDWAPDNRRVALAALSEGRPILRIVDADTGDVERELGFDTLDQIFTPAWSPDGRAIAFAGLSGGLMDLYAVTLEDATLRRITDDPYTDVHPEWSPDGAVLVWASDRFTSDLEALSFGEPRLAAAPVAGGDIRLLTGFATGANTNPEFAPDGRTLYFVGAPDGVANLYRVPIDGDGPGLTAGPAERLTNVQTGVRGITTFTPALSVATTSGRVVMTGFEDGNYHLFHADANELQPAGGLDQDAAQLPPRTARDDEEVAGLLRAPARGLPAPRTYATREYQPSLGFDAVTPVSIGVGTDSYGTYAAGGIGARWSDMLGNHMLGATVRASGRLDETGGALQYLNRTSRWTWGIEGLRSPFVSRSIIQGSGSLDGSTVIVQQTARHVQVDHSVNGIAQYPFSRALRMEYTGGVRHLGFSRTVDQQFFDPVTGRLVAERSDDLPAPDNLWLGQASAALVWDSAVYGPVGPLVGQRYRLEYSQVAGDLTYGGVLADYRRYFRPGRPFTIAVRGLHYGRYGGDSEDVRLQPLFLGSQGLVRGYDLGSFEPAECLDDGAPATCAPIDRLFGSRLGVASIELRVPPFGFGSGSLYGPLPFEVALFGDMGVTWNSTTSPALTGGSRDLVRSAGVALRLNLGGYAVAEVDFVRPFDRPNEEWRWQFGFTPAF